MSIRKSVETRVHAAQSAIKGAGEMYHCNAAVADHGLGPVVAERAKNLAREYQTLSAPDAMMLAAREVGLMNAIAAGKRPFYDVRRRLDAQAQEQSALRPGDGLVNG